MMHETKQNKFQTDLWVYTYTNQALNIWHFLVWFTMKPSLKIIIIIIEACDFSGFFLILGFFYKSAFASEMFLKEEK